MKSNVLLGLGAIAIIGLILGFTLGKHLSSEEADKVLEENKKLRKELNKNIAEVVLLRKGLAKERQAFSIEINKSIARYDSLETVSRNRQAKLLLEIRRLKMSTVKELEDEAERIYNSAVNNH